MKRSTLALCTVAAACCGGVAAETAPSGDTVQIMGSLDVYAGLVRNAGDAGSLWAVNNGGRAGSWFGLQGQEQLGGGYKASFLLTSYIAPDLGRAGRGGSDGFWSRDAQVALTGPFGAVSAGRLLAPDYLPMVVANPFGGSFQFSPLLLHADNTLSGGRYTPTVPSDTSWNNAVIYTTPAVGGFTLSLHYQFGEQPANTAKSGAHNAGTSMFYLQGPWSLTAFYERAEIGNDFFSTNPNGAINKVADWMFGGSYDFGFARLYATSGKAVRSASTVNTSAQTNTLGLAIPLGRGKILAGWAKTNVAAGNDRTTATLGYDYELSKRTGLYAMARTDRLTGYASGSSYGLGIRHRF